MKKQEILVNSLIRGMLRILCKIDTRELEQIPQNGPLIIVVNHINFLEAPILHLFTTPRPINGLVKQETWQQPFLGYLARLWDAIPIDRSGKDLSGIRRAEEHLRKGGILIVAPEGTRSGDGRLQAARAGVVALAARTGSDILPLAHYGGESFWPRIRRLKRSKICFCTGPRLSLKNQERAPRGKERQQALDELMLSLARLLPESYHGVYADLVQDYEERELSFFITDECCKNC